MSDRLRSPPRPDGGRRVNRYLSNADNGVYVLSWFKKREVPTFIHPVLGKLELLNGAWFGEYEFGAEKLLVHLSVDDQKGRPLTGAGKFVQEFESRYQALIAPISVELRQLFEPWYEEFWDRSEPLPEPDALFAMFQLTAIDFFGKGNSLVEFALKENWDDGRFRISLEEWIPEGLGVED